MPIRNLAKWNQQKTLERFWDGEATIERLAMMPNDALIYVSSATACSFSQYDPWSIAVLQIKEKTDFEEVKHRHPQRPERPLFLSAG